jgi:hypothetical protein
MKLKRLAPALAAMIVLGAATTALAAATLSGKYTTTIKGDSALGGALNGTWVIHFTKGAYHVFENGHAITHGKDTVKANTITFHDTGGTGVCPGTGKYKFNLTGNKLRFTVISDSSSCAGRKGVLTHGALTKTS